MTLVQLIEHQIGTSARLPFAVAVLLCATAVYAGLLAFYRLYWSPLAKIPGPKLAALTQWVETYYEIIHGKGGQFIWQFRKWHEQYGILLVLDLLGKREVDRHFLGPIVRVSPNEVHIQDSDFFHTFFSPFHKLNKVKRVQKRFRIPEAGFVAANHEIHRSRRAALNPYFSTRRVALQSPSIQNRMNRLCDRLQGEYAGSGRVLKMDHMWGCLASDIVVEYCLNRTYRFIESPDFRASFVDAMYDLMDGIHVGSQFPWIISLIDSLPDSLVKILQPGMATVLAFHKVSMWITFHDVGN